MGSVSNTRIAGSVHAKHTVNNVSESLSDTDTDTRMAHQSVEMKPDPVSVTFVSVTPCLLKLTSELSMSSTTSIICSGQRGRELHGTLKKNASQQVRCPLTHNVVKLTLLILPFSYSTQTLKSAARTVESLKTTWTAKIL